MKKKVIILILTIILSLFILGNLLYDLIYFTSFNKNSRTITEVEKEKIIELLSKTIETTGYEIKFGNVYTVRNREIAQVQLLKERSKKEYLVDLSEWRILKK